MIKYFDLGSGQNYSLTKPTICGKFNEIGDMSCMILLCFLVDTLLEISTLSYNNFHSMVVS